MSYPRLCNTWAFSVYGRTWNIPEQCEQRGCIAVHVFLAADRHLFFYPYHYASDNQSGGSLKMITSQGRLSQLVLEQHMRKILFSGR